MGQIYEQLHDVQQDSAVAVCAHCHKEIYRSDFRADDIDRRIYRFDGALIHGECLGEYALEHCCQVALGELAEEAC